MILKKQQHGFTLIELLIAVGIFTAIVVVSTSLFISIIKAQRKAFAEQIVQDEARQTMEFMVNELKKSSGYDVDPANNVLSFADSKFFRKNGDNLEFFDGANILTLNSSKVVITRARFQISGNLNGNPGEGDRHEAAFLNIGFEDKNCATSNKPELCAKVDLQTVVSSRKY